MTFRTYRGTCHCGAVEFEIDAEPTELTTCDCSICRRRNALMVKVHESKLRLLRGEKDLTLYEFHTNTAKHFFCKHCGIPAFYVPRSDPDKIDVNVRCIDNVDLSALSVKTFDGKNWEEAMGQRVPWR